MADAKNGRIMRRRKGCAVKIRFFCPECNRKYKVSAKSVGTTFTCHCGQNVQIPYVSAAKTLQGANASTEGPSDKGVLEEMSEFCKVGTPVYWFFVVLGGVAGAMFAVVAALARR